MNFHSFRYIIKVTGVQPKAGFNNAGDAGDYLEAIQQSDNPMAQEYRIIDQQEAQFNQARKLNAADAIIQTVKQLIKNMEGDQ